jgi:hypothetical protein
MDGSSTCPQVSDSPYNGESCMQYDDGTWHTRDGSRCPTKDYHQSYTECTYDATEGNYVKSDGTLCNWEITYEFMCFVKTDQMMNGDNIWEKLDDAIECPEMITYYGSSSDVNFETYTGYYFHWYETDPWAPDESQLYTLVMCFFDETNNQWAGEDGVSCPQ